MGKKKKKLSKTNRLLSMQTLFNLYPIALVALVSDREFSQNSNDFLSISLPGWTIILRPLTVYSNIKSFQLPSEEQTSRSAS